MSTTTARELWKIYEEMNDPSLAVSVALAKDIIKIENVPENCRALVARMSDIYQLKEQ